MSLVVGTLRLGATRELLDVLTRSDAGRVALIGWLHQRDGAGGTIDSRSKLGWMMSEALDHDHAGGTSEHLASREKVWRRIVIVAVAAFLVAGIAILVVGIGAPRRRDWHGPPRSQVVAVWLQPYSEGSPGYPYTSPAADPWAIFYGARPLERMLPDIPDPLPSPSSQSFCSTESGSVVVLLSGGRTILYGPCRRPGSINRLLSAMKARWGAQ